MKSESDKTTIELRHFQPNSTVHNEVNNLTNLNDVSTSRVPLIPGKSQVDYKLSNLQLSLETQFRKLNSITNLSRIINFTYVCLLLDVVVNSYYGFLLISHLSDITKLVLCSLYLINYIVSLWNTVMYITIIITYNDYSKLKEEKLKEEIVLKINKKDNSKPKIEGLKPMIDVTLNITEPVAQIKAVIPKRVITWIIKSLLYCVIIKYNTEYRLTEYLNIFLIIIEYFFAKILNFYLKVLLRMEAFKVLYGFEDISD